MIALEIEPNK